MQMRAEYVMAQRTERESVAGWLKKMLGDDTRFPSRELDKMQGINQNGE